MPDIDASSERKNYWAEQFLEHRARLLALAERNLHPMLRKRISAEDAVQETLASACEKIEFFENSPETPLYFKLRMLLFQTLTSLERKHLQSQKRDAYKEVEVASDDATAPAGQVNWNLFADTVTGPFTRIARRDRYELLRQALKTLSDNDRQILEMRHFDGMSNTECAEALKIEPKAASIRYIRALQRLQQKLKEFTEFQS
ncbi:MAG: sigma-70 family RNA polymerase sigma factor [Lentisphaeria bacterium]|nr:sigma-70 family RNA polymerase sigma factor [Lentisphaeria bacterium]